MTLAGSKGSSREIRFTASCTICGFYLHEWPHDGNTFIRGKFGRKKITRCLKKRETKGKSEGQNGESKKKKARKKRGKM
jgi:hypothetical protein